MATQVLDYTSTRAGNTQHPTPAPNPASKKLRFTQSLRGVYSVRLAPHRIQNRKSRVLYMLEHTIMAERSSAEKVPGSSQNQRGEDNGSPPELTNAA